MHGGGGSDLLHTVAGVGRSRGGGSDDLERLDVLGSGEGNLEHWEAMGVGFTRSDNLHISSHGSVMAMICNIGCWTLRLEKEVMVVVGRLIFSDC